MKHLTEYRDGAKAKELARRIAEQVSRPWSIMEVCGGQTHSIIRNGIDQVLPDQIQLIHGPGCPVCVTPVEVMDRAIEIARLPDVIFCTFGDMLRVPGSKDDLFRVRAEGAEVRIVYSPMDCLRIARENRDREIVFLAIGFETTAPAVAMTVKVARDQGLRNFSALVSHVLVPPAIETILQTPGHRVDAFLAAGHVCCVTGLAPYPELCERYGAPIVVTGFEPLDILDGIRRAVVQLESGQAFVENAYPRVVPEAGNPVAQQTIAEIFEVTDQTWRGMGQIPSSGWRLRQELSDYDAELKFAVKDISVCESKLCRAGDVLTGLIKPNECAAFGDPCNPQNPLGATMVSSEGACAAYYNYGRMMRSSPGE